MSMQFLIVLCAVLSIAFSQTALDDRQKFQNSDFVFDLAGSKPNVVGLAGTGRRASISELPSLSGIGISSVLFHIEACGINLPHIHPRATELFYVVEGSFQTAFLEENGGRVILNNLTQGQTTFFPRGHIHFEQNLGCSKATFLSAFNSEDPGVVTIPNRLYDIPIQALTSSFNNTEDVINQLKSKLVANPAMGVGECRKRCGLDVISGSSQIKSGFLFVNFAFLISVSISFLL
jgi:oxalate decarboxylase/phosphoglucose isomerase-like protein (cupin superfamily)